MVNQTAEATRENVLRVVFWCVMLDEMRSGGTRGPISWSRKPYTWESLSQRMPRALRGRRRKKQSKNRDVTEKRREM